MYQGVTCSVAVNADRPLLCPLVVVNNDQYKKALYFYLLISTVFHSTKE